MPKGPEPPKVYDDVGHLKREYHPGKALDLGFASLRVSFVTPQLDSDSGTYVWGWRWSLCAHVDGVLYDTRAEAAWAAVDGAHRVLTVARNKLRPKIKEARKRREEHDVGGDD